MKTRFIKRLSALFLSGLCATMLGGALVSCKSDPKEILDSDYTITLSPDDGQVAVKETLVITPEFSDPKAAELKYKWLSLNLNAATVVGNEDGSATVTGVEPGTVEIKIVCTTIPLLSAICTVEVFPRTVALDKGFDENDQPVVEKIFKGTTLVITPSFGGAGTADMDFTWTSSDTEVATVVEGANNTVTVTGVTPGTAKITITSDDDPELTASCGIEVVAYTITLTPNIGTLRKNATVTVTPEFNDPAAGEFEYTWVSDKPEIATVTENTDGTAAVTGVADGIAKITVTCDTDPTLTASRNVTVETWSVALDKSAETIEELSTLTLTPIFTPAAASSLTYTWGSSDETKATVVRNSDGSATVTAKAEGETIITVKAAEDATITASCVVTVIALQGPAFVFDKAWIDGSAVSAGKTEISATLENPEVFAWYGDLAAGELTIPSEFESEAGFVAPADGAAEFAATTGAAVEDAMTSATASTWTIPAAGKYRVVLDRTAKTMAVYSPEIDLQPKTVEWVANSTTHSTTVTDFFILGEAGGWGTNPVTDKDGFTVSAADPQILVWNKVGTGTRLGSADWANQRTKFVVWGDPAPIYTFSRGNGANVNLSLRTIAPLVEGYDNTVRESWYNYNKGVFVNFIIVDVRNMTVYADYRE